MRKWLLTAGVLFACAFADHTPTHDYTSYQNGSVADRQVYRTTNITSPIFNYNTWRKDLLVNDASSHLLLTLAYSKGAAGPYIFHDEDLSLVYADPSFDYAMLARIQAFEGENYLTLWHGAMNRGDSQGFCVFYDDHYVLRWNVTTGPPLSVDADMHECEVTADGTVLLTAYQDKPWDLSGVGGEVEDVLSDSCFQEVDIRSNAGIFTWCASDYFAPDLTFWKYSMSSRRMGRGLDERGDGKTTSRGFDAYHINSLQKTNEGNYLISLRNLNSLVYINGTTGHPIWNLNGKLNNFTDVTPPPYLAQNPETSGPEPDMALGFAWQHDAKFHDNEQTHLTLFDNHALNTTLNCTGSPCSRGRHLNLNTSALTVHQIQDFRSPQGLQSVIFGSVQPLPPSAFLVSWGVHAEFTEYTTPGDLVRDVQYSRLYAAHSVGGPGVQSTRVYKQAWRGHPTWPPSIHAERGGRLWVSWNGATEVREWAVYGGREGERGGSAEPAGGSLRDVKPVVVVRKSGFETEIRLGEKQKVPGFVQVAALDSRGEVIGLTETVRVGAEVRSGWISFLDLCKLLV